MHATTLLAPGILTLALLASCGSAPKPPTVDETRKRPANTATAVELQVCRSDLQNTRLLANETGRLAETTAATLVSLSARQQALAHLQAADAHQPQGNSVYSLRFGFGSSRLEMAPDVAKLLVDEAKTAPLVMLRGRTDGTRDSAAENRVARERAAAVRDFLIAAGVEPSRIRATYQPVGDPVADNGDATGRALNRRVEIEIYRTLPVALTTAAARR